jgi:cytidylate kinase
VIIHTGTTVGLVARDQALLKKPRYYHFPKLVSKRRKVMAIITISRGSYSRGKEVAEKVAKKLGYECIARDTLLEASKQSHIPEIKLVRAIHDAPSILEHFFYGKEKYIAHIQAALVQHVQTDNVVYHGLAGHFFLYGISHVLKVRIVAELENRIKEEMLRENISYKEALRVIKRDDEQRRKWSRYLYGIDTRDTHLYDLALHIKKIKVDDAVDVICHTVGLKIFKTTPQSQKAMDDLVLASAVKVRLIDLKSDIEVRADDGIVFVKTKADMSTESKLAREIKRTAEAVPGVNEVHVEVHSPTLFRS